MKTMEPIYIGMLIIALILIYFAIKNYNTTKNLITNGVKTQATVIDLIKVKSDDGYNYKPVFEYNDKAKNIFTFKSEISSSPAPYAIGDNVSIIYSTDNKNRKIVSFWGLYRWTLILLSIASPLLIIGGGYLLYTRG
ncbi:DUF3592 domain-containing protein [Aquimarina litoralis]|uniref:DUF3592 domain-containing protein n=1 Tax=Aquimarina litoralis TaxID=584605 RepID=UPI001C5690F9|nr:DUF3592 domain-containing protein [Aquimarina litoralis]MBW1296711.1 DUF3592 domain-containing protein [Aquimarina litoralis]